MSQFETIKTKLNELEAKRDQLSGELQELSQAINDSFEDLLLGKVDEKTIDQAKERFEAVQAEIVKNEDLIQRAIVVRKKLAREQVIPFAKEKRAKATATTQAKY